MRVKSLVWTKPITNILIFDTSHEFISKSVFLQVPFSILISIFLAPVLVIFHKSDQFFSAVRNSKLRHIPCLTYNIFLPSFYVCAIFLSLVKRSDPQNSRKLGKSSRAPCSDQPCKWKWNYCMVMASQSPCEEDKQSFLFQRD